MSEAGFPHDHSAHGKVFTWRRGPARPRLAPAEVHVWRARLSRSAEDAQLLSDAERERASQIVGERDRLFWSRARCTLRVLLARYVDSDPRTLVLGTGENGKPYLERDSDDDAQALGVRRAPHFNLSHSGELALYAFCSEAEVGVDVELLYQRHSSGPADRVALARRAFGEQEGRRLSMVEPARREHEFLRAWTRHEAELKRRGAGLGAASFGDLATGEARAEPWIVELDVGPRAVAALAVEFAPAAGPRLWDWA
jgi:4'-phosphopantetheinyl transferase